MRRVQPIPPLGSAFLDVLRFCSAVLVLVGHFSHPQFLDNGSYHLDWALYAVGVFFVLSGFVIRFITCYRPTTARTYAVDRASRIYSVYIPSVVFSVLATLLLTPHLFTHDLFAGAVNLTTLAQLWGSDVFVSTNSVYWSLCYECFYYLIYGVAFFASGRLRVLSLLAIALLIGPPILLMFPLWLLGAGVHDLYQRLRERPMQSLSKIAGLGAAAAIALLAVRRLQLLHSPVVASAASAARHLVQPVLQSAKEHHLHLLARANFQFYLSGGGAAVVMLVALLLLDGAKVERNAPAIRITRRIADGTFAVYMFHMPMLLLIRAYIPYSGSSMWQRGLIGICVVALCVYIQGPLDLLKDWMRLRFEKFRAPVMTAN
jgi:peptidoglycan/LPS O-acetylase OafA/YrhL